MAKDKIKLVFEIDRFKVIGCVARIWLFANVWRARMKHFTMVKVAVVMVTAT